MPKQQQRGMTFWDFVNEAWPTERGWVTIGLFAVLTGLLSMAQADPRLWDVEVFKVIIQAVSLTGLLNMILAFHFAANKSDEAKAQNTSKLADAFKSVAENSTGGTATTTDTATDSPDSEPGLAATGKQDDPVHIVQEEKD